jgi:hypothetical protein
MIGIDNYDLAKRYNEGRLSRERYMRELKKRSPRVEAPYEFFPEQPAVWEDTRRPCPHCIDGLGAHFPGRPAPSEELLRAVAAEHAKPFWKPLKEDQGNE